MSEKAIYKVAIIGGGEMGANLAMLFAQKGKKVVIKELNQEKAEEAQKKILAGLEKAVNTGKIMPDKADNAKKIISVTANYDELIKIDPDEKNNVGLVLEAVDEKMKTKQTVFKELDAILPPHIIFATNTSSLSITEMASVTNRQDKVAGVHFFNPPVTMALVELIAAQQTSSETLEILHNFVKDLGKTPIKVKECPGFLVNRLLMPYLNEATILLSETTLTAEEIDAKAADVKVGFGWPMGPFALMDYLGIDVCVEVAKILYAGYGERAKPAPLMGILANLGRKGTKKGPAGFYVADKTKGFEPLNVIIDREFPQRQNLDIEEGFRRMMLGLINEAFLCLEEKIATAEDIEKGCINGIGFPYSKKGPIHWAESEGLDKILADLKRFEQQYGARFKPAKLLEEYVASGKKIFEDKTNEDDSW